MRPKLVKLEKLVAKKVQKAKLSADRTKKEAATLGHAAAGSWSVGAERNFAEGQAAISAENLSKLEKLLSEIRASLDKEPDFVNAVCYLEIEYEDGRSASFYLVDNPAYLKEVTLISSNSELGKALIDSKEGDKVTQGNSGLTIIAIG